MVAKVEESMNKETLELANKINEKLNLDLESLKECKILNIKGVFVENELENGNGNWIEKGVLIIGMKNCL